LIPTIDIAEVGAEAGGKGTALGQHAASLGLGKPGVLHGTLFGGDPFGFHPEEDAAHLRERNLLFANYTLDFDANHLTDNLLLCF